MRNTKIAQNVERKHKVSEAARVTFSVGYTKNMGDFNSLRVDVGLSDSVQEGETLEEASDRVYSFVSEELVKRIENELKE